MVFPVLNRFLPLLLVAVLLIADLLLKAWAARTLPAMPSQPLIPGLLNLNFTLNTGMAWGMLENLTLPLAGLRLVVAVGLIVALLLRHFRCWTALALSLLAAGAFSNAVDGLTRGAVVDYLSSPLLDQLHRLLNGQPFPVFNGADMLVIAGVALLLLSLPKTTPSPNELRETIR
ncbi:MULTISPECIES: signal peptidase II [Deinococcus]|nr:signal peptidase II [Deinococcus cavernae]